MEHFVVSKTLVPPVVQNVDPAFTKALEATGVGDVRTSRARSPPGRPGRARR